MLKLCRKENGFHFDREFTLSGRGVFRGSMENRERPPFWQRVHLRCASCLQKQHGKERHPHSDREFSLPSLFWDEKATWIRESTPSTMVSWFFPGGRLIDSFRFLFGILSHVAKSQVQLPMHRDRHLPWADAAGHKSLPRAANDSP